MVNLNSLYGRADVCGRAGAGFLKRPSGVQRLLSWAMSLKGGTFMSSDMELLLPHARAYLRAGCTSNDVTSKNITEDEIEGNSNRTNDYRTNPVVSTDCRAPTIKQRQVRFSPSSLRVSPHKHASQTVP